MDGVTDEDNLSPAQTDMLITIERTGASLSMVAIILTISTFVAFKRLRTTPNLFLVFASLANAGASIASMMGYDGLVKGNKSSLCQAQAFIFEWFMQSDPWWSFAMALNVFLVFFLNVNPSVFRKYAWAYCIACFGGPMIPAIVLISIRGDPRGPVFGDATLWCWIGSNWGHVRLYAYYIPIWICILSSTIIYVAVGFRVFYHRNRLRHFNRQDSAKTAPTTDTRSAFGESSEEILRAPPDCYGTVVTEVQVTSDQMQYDRQGLPVFPRQQNITVVTCGTPAPSVASTNRPISRHLQKQRRPKLSIMSSIVNIKTQAMSKWRRLDPVKMAYLRTSFIFGFSVLITWIPSSINRLYSLANDGKVSFQLSVASGCVLPLQGVWNAIIYFTTGCGIIKEELDISWSNVRQKFRRQDETSPPIAMNALDGPRPVHHTQSRYDNPNTE